MTEGVEFLNKILKIVANCPHSPIQLTAEDFLKAMGLDPQDANAKEELEFHIRCLREENFLLADDETFRDNVGSVYVLNHVTGLTPKGSEYASAINTPKYQDAIEDIRRSSSPFTVNEILKRL